jgi:hypothetical protein
MAKTNEIWTVANVQLEEHNPLEALYIWTNSYESFDAALQAVEIERRELWGNEADCEELDILSVDGVAQTAQSQNELYDEFLECVWVLTHHA